MNEILKKKLIESGIIPRHMTQLMNLWSGDLKTVSEEVEYNLNSLVEEVIELTREKDDLPVIKITRLDADHCLSERGVPAVYCDNANFESDCIAASMENNNFLLFAKPEVASKIVSGGYLIHMNVKYTIYRVFKLYQDGDVIYLECKVGL